jgi:hypothetical protein
MLVGAASASAEPGRERLRPSRLGAEIATRAVARASDVPRSGWVGLALGTADNHLDRCGRRVDDLTLIGYAVSSFARGTPRSPTRVLISNADVCNPDDP